MLGKAASIASGVALALAVVLVVLAVGATLSSKSGEASFFGWKPYIVASDSMQDTFEAGDVAVSGPVDAADVQPGDIITFVSIDPGSYGEVITHKVRSVTEYGGQLAFVTYGTTTGVDDEYPALASNVLGKYAFSIPRVGELLGSARTPVGYVMVVLVPFVVLIGLQVRNFMRLLRADTDEAADGAGSGDAEAGSTALPAEHQRLLELQAAELAAEREKVEQMRIELEQLRSENDSDEAPRGKHAKPRAHERRN